MPIRFAQLQKEMLQFVALAHFRQLRDRLMVGQRPLKPFVLVRIQVPQFEFGTIW